jgi:hypothetical protein
MIVGVSDVDCSLLVDVHVVGVKQLVEVRPGVAAGASAGHHLPDARSCGELQDGVALKICDVRGTIAGNEEATWICYLIA